MGGYTTKVLMLGMVDSKCEKEVTDIIYNMFPEFMFHIFACTNYMK
jgi:hypothetical protein